MPALARTSELIGRLLLGFIFLHSGLGKMGSAYAGTQAYMDSVGVPGSLLPLAIVVEVVGGAAIMLGLQTRFTALALAGFTVLAAVLFHANFADQMQFIMFLKNVAITGGFLILAAHGAGPWSIDARRRVR